jgi:hypothetical protein
MKILTSIENLWALDDDLDEIKRAIFPKIFGWKNIPQTCISSIHISNIYGEEIEFSYIDVNMEEDYILVPMDWILNPNLIDPSFEQAKKDREREIQNGREAEAKVKIETELKLLAELKVKYEGKENEETSTTQEITNTTNT